MINIKLTKQKCCEDITLIENFSEAINSEGMFDCHHRLETHFSDGTERPRDARLSKDELIALDMYYDRPASELIFLSHSEHARLHSRGNTYGHGRIPWNKGTKGVMKAWNKGIPMTEEQKKKLSEVKKNISEETRNKMRIAAKKRNAERYKDVPKKVKQESKRKLTKKYYLEHLDDLGNIPSRQAAEIMNSRGYPVSKTAILKWRKENITDK